MDERNVRVASSGIGYGCVLATVISWSVNHSVLWAILHGICSWFYVFYWLIWGTSPWIK